MSKNIYKQLRDMGAPESEADSLSHLAGRISEVKPRGMSDATKRRMFAEIPVTYRPHQPLRWSIAGSLAVVVLLAVVAQSALPGSWLYGVKRATEETRATVQPSYTESIAEERKTEVEKLEKKETIQPQVLKEAEKRAEDAFKRSEEQQRKKTNNDTEQNKKLQERLKQFEEWRQQRRERYNQYQPNSWGDWDND